MPALAADRVGLLILLLATLAGLWLGLAGPDTSPVAPPGSPPIPVLGALTNFLSSGVGGGGGR
jgi:hypothetical protein